MSHEVGLDELAALLRGELEPSRRRRVAEHVRACAECGRQLALLRRASAAFPDPARPGRRRSPVRRLILAVLVLLAAALLLRRLRPDLFGAIAAALQRLVRPAGG